MKTIKLLQSTTAFEKGRSGTFSSGDVVVVADHVADMFCQTGRLAELTDEEPTMVAHEAFLTPPETEEKAIATEGGIEAAIPPDTSEKATNEPSGRPNPKQSSANWKKPNKNK